MDWRILATRAGKVAAGNSPAILTAIGATGVVATAVLAGKASIKAAEIIREHDEDLANAIQPHNPPLTPKEKVELVWKEFLPAAGVGLLTIACIVTANRIGARRIAALATAYNIAGKAAETYADKVIETIGKKKNDTIRAAVAQDEIDRHPIGRETIYIEGGGTDIFRDSWSGRYFNSSVDRLEKAANEINRQLNSSFYASLSDFYDFVGLERTEESDNVGWNSNEMLELHFDWGRTADDRPCGVLRFRVKPIEDYTSFH